MARRGVLVVLLLLLAATGGARGHSGGADATEARIEFPPWVLWAAAGGVVVVSFGVVGAYLSRRDLGVVARAPAPGRGGPGPRIVASAAGLVTWIGVAIAPFASVRFDAVPQLALWVVLAGVLPMVAYLLGNPWPRCDPFQVVVHIGNALRRGRRVGYPAALGRWPAAALALAFVALEVGTRLDGRTLGALMLAYLAFQLAAVLVFEPREWLDHAELFGVAMAWWSRLPLTSPGRWAAGQAMRRGDTAVVLALLVGVNLDGFLATGLGRAARAHAQAAAGPAAVGLVVLAGFAVFGLALYGAALAARRFAHDLSPASQLASTFAPSLMPIAAGYHLAHVLPAVLETIYAAVPATVWVGIVQLSFILGGHVLAIVASHRSAFERFDSRIQAIRSEAPVTAAMVVYTVVGMWILTAAAGGAA